MQAFEKVVSNKRYMVARYAISESGDLKVYVHAIFYSLFKFYFANIAEVMHVSIVEEPS